MHGCAPKVIPEQISDGCLGAEVLILHDGRHVVKDEATVQGIVVDGSSGDHQDDAVKCEVLHASCDTSWSCNSIHTL